jgi:hypothetical protein
VIKDSATPPTLEIWAQSDKASALADIKIEIAKNAGGAPLTVTTGTTAVAWTATKPGNYEPFDKTVTGALSLPVDTKTYTGTGGTIYLKQTGNVVNLTIVCSAKSGYNSGAITVAQITDVGCRPDSSIDWTGRAAANITSTFTLAVDGTVSYTCSSACNVEARTYNITYVVNNVAAAHLVSDPPIDFTSEITGAAWTDATNKVAKYSRTTGLVQIQYQLPASVGYADTRKIVIPAKYRPAAADIYGTMTWQGYNTGANTGAYIKNADGKIYIINNDNSNYLSTPFVMNVSFAYYVEPESGAYVIRRYDDVFDGNGLSAETATGDTFDGSPVYRKAWNRTNAIAFDHNITGLNNIVRFTISVRENGKWYMNGYTTQTNAGSVMNPTVNSTQISPGCAGTWNVNKCIGEIFYTKN